MNLRAQILRDGIGGLHDRFAPWLDLGQRVDLVGSASRALKDRHTVLVKCDSVARDIDRDTFEKWIVDKSPIVYPPCLSLPYASVWMEFRDDPGATDYGCLATRREKGRDVYIIFDRTPLRMGGLPCAFSLIFVKKGEYGDVTETRGEIPDTFPWQVFINAIGRMNCRNVGLQPLRGSAGGARAARQKITPMSMWREIVVSGAPCRKGPVPHQPCGHESRFHPIRGHWADYRQGPGLFGKQNLRYIYWIPEHYAGNPELGEIVPEYVA